MLELKNVSKYYSNNGVVTLGLRNINLRFKAGEIVAITGDSGSGKSTLLNVITAVDTYEEGEIYFQGNETSYFNQNDMDMFRKNHISFIFQNYNIIDSYTVLENVMLPLILNGKSFEEARKEAIEIIDKVGLTKRIKHKGTKLSGGEKQRCVIARALTGNAKILACDEPTGNLDSETGAEIIKLIQEVAQDRLVLIVTHNYEQVKDIITRRIKISDGEIVEDVSVVPVETLVEPQEELTLEEKRIRKPVFLKLMLQNIISTPKKSIFSILVFMVISFITLILCLMMLQQSFDTYHYENNSYHLQTKDRMIVYDADHNILDKEILDQSNHTRIIYNGMYEEMPFSFEYKKDGNVYSSSYLTYITDKKISYTIKEGKDMSADGECVIVFPKNFYIDYYFMQALENEIVLSGFGENKQQTIARLKGIAVSDEISFGYPYLVMYSSISQRLINTLNNFNIEPYFELEGATEKTAVPKKDIYTLVNRKKSYISCPIEFKDRIKFSFLLNDLYEINYSNIEIVYDSVASFGFYMGEDYYNGELVPEFKGIYEAVIYTHSISDAKAYFESKGYKVSIPTQMQIEPGMLNLVVLYMFLALTIISLIGLYYITYVILARVYASKNKDYGVLRTLGMVKKQLGRIAELEVVLLGLLSAVFSLLLFIILYFTTDVFSMGAYLGVGIIVFYFILMILFSYFLARRFNRRLFKFSVNTTLKGEVARND